MSTHRYFSMQQQPNEKDSKKQMDYEAGFDDLLKGGSVSSD